MILNLYKKLLFNDSKEGFLQFVNLPLREGNRVLMSLVERGCIRMSSPFRIKILKPLEIIEFDQDAQGENCGNEDKVKNVAS